MSIGRRNAGLEFVGEKQRRGFPHSVAGLGLSSQRTASSLSKALAQHLQGCTEAPGGGAKEWPPLIAHGRIKEGRSRGNQPCAARSSPAEGTYPVGLLYD